MRDRTCDNCGRYIEGNETLFEMTITLRAEPGPELELEAPSDEIDLLEDLQKLVEAMEKMSQEQVDEATDQVHETASFTLCTDCRGEVHRRMRRHRDIIEM